LSLSTRYSGRQFPLRMTIALRPLGVGVQLLVLEPVPPPIRHGASHPGVTIWRGWDVFLGCNVTSCMYPRILGRIRSPFILFDHAENEFRRCPGAGWIYAFAGR